MRIFLFSLFSLSQFRFPCFGSLSRTCWCVCTHCADGAIETRYPQQSADVRFGGYFRSANVQSNRIENATGQCAVDARKYNACGQLVGNDFIFDTNTATRLIETDIGRKYTYIANALYQINM